MNYPLIWDNLVAYSMQIGLLVGLAAFVPAALRLRLPGGRLAYWHMLLGACLVLPALRPWKQAVITLSSYVPPSAPAKLLPRTPPAAVHRLDRDRFLPAAGRDGDPHDLAGVRHVAIRTACAGIRRRWCPNARGARRPTSAFPTRLRVR